MQDLIIINFVGNDRVQMVLQSNDGVYAIHKLTTYTGGLYPTYSIEGGSTRCTLFRFKNVKFLTQVVFRKFQSWCKCSNRNAINYSGFLPMRMSTSQRNAIFKSLKVCNCIMLLHTNQIITMVHHGVLWCIRSNSIKL